MSLSDALNESAETATPDTSVEETTDQGATDSSLITNESVEATTDEAQEKPDEAKLETIDQVRNWGKGWETTAKTRETELTGLNERLTNVQSLLSGVGGEAQLSIMQPFLEVAQQLPRNDQEVEAWAPNAWESLGKSLVPAQIEGMRAEAAWEYLRNPGGAKLVCEALYGSEVSPSVIQRLVDIYKQDPAVLDDPNETTEQRLARERSEESARRAEASQQATQNELKQIRDREATRETQALMGEVYKAALTPQAEVKKQYGLEYQKGNDTPELASFKQRQSVRYDRMVKAAMLSDSELNRLANLAEYQAGQKDPAQKGLANSKYGPLMQQRVTKICGEIAKDLAEDLKLLNPENSDLAKANNLKDIKPNLLGGASAGGGQAELGAMPDPTEDPVGFQRWASGLARQRQAQDRSPALLA